MTDEALLEAYARSKGLTLTELRMSSAVTDADMADLRQMARSDRMVPSSPIASAGKRNLASKQRDAWVDSAPLEQPYVNHVDRLCEAQAEVDAAELRRWLGGGG